MHADHDQKSALNDGERVLIRAFALFRFGGIAQVAIVIVFAHMKFTSLWGSTGLACGLAVESAIVVGLSAAAGRLLPRVVAADVALCSVGILLGSRVTLSAYGTTWANFMYPFTIIASIGIGLAFRRYLTVLMLTLCFAGAYIVAALSMHHDPVWNIVPNAITYLPNTAVAWAVARQLRRSATRLDQAHADAVARTAELTSQRERLRHASLLHDRVLQTLEFLATGPWLSDLEIRAHVAAEAAWLRALVQGQDSSTPDDLHTALLEVVQRHIRLGMRIELNATGLLAGDGNRPCSPEVVRSLAQSTHEALTNIRKHAGTNEATLFATIADGQTIVSVVDKGRGFNPATTPSGMGLGNSMSQALHNVGGKVAVHSSPGQGTSVEFTVPLPAITPEPETRTGAGPSGGAGRPRMGGSLAGVAG